MRRRGVSPEPAALCRVITVAVPLVPLFPGALEEALRHKERLLCLRVRHKDFELCPGLPDLSVYSLRAEELPELLRGLPVLCHGDSSHFALPPAALAEAAAGFPGAVAAAGAAAGRPSPKFLIWTSH